VCVHMLSLQGTGLACVCRNVYGFPQDRATNYKMVLLPGPNNSIAWQTFVQGVFYQVRHSIAICCCFCCFRGTPWAGPKTHQRRLPACPAPLEQCLPLSSCLPG
jgi:hypothetical protein